MLSKITAKNTIIYKLRLFYINFGSVLMRIVKIHDMVRNSYRVFLTFNILICIRAVQKVIGYPVKLGFQ